MELQFCIQIFLLFWGCAQTFGANILILHPIYGGSHILALQAFAEALAERGHNIDIIRWKEEHNYNFQRHDNITTTVLAMDNKHGRWSVLSTEKEATFISPHRQTLDEGESLQRLDIAYLIFDSLFLLESQCDTLLGNKLLISRLEKAEYKIGIIDISFNECGLALLHHLGVPAVGYYALPFNGNQAEFTTAFIPASHTPYLTSQFSPAMNFRERTLNLVYKIVAYIVLSSHFHITNLAVQRHYPGTPNPSDLLKNVSGMLVNGDSVLDYPRLLPPTFINVGGMHIRKTKPLPKDIENWMRSSGKEGVVLFSMGFTYDIKLLPNKLVNSFMDAFSRFPQLFLVKSEVPIPLKYIPSNVKVLNWIPQQDVLAHPATRAFVAHCGSHGLLESAYNGVPMVCMPFTVDQLDNVVKVKEKRIALGLNRHNATTEDIYQALKEILFNPEYKENAEELSRMMRDTKETPTERAVDFTEFIIRHKGADYLKLESRNLHWIQYFSLDSIIFLIFLSFTAAFTVYGFTKFIAKGVKTVFASTYTKYVFKVTSISEKKSL